MKFIRTLLFGNENPLVRFVRLCIFAGVAAAIAAGVENAPMVDWPGEYDGLVGGIVLAGLAAADKFVRNLRATE